MKKTVITVVAAATLCTAVYAVHQININDKDVLTANLEALTDDESSSGSNYNICYSNSKVRKGETYYDCGRCQKVYDEKGKGDYTKCFY